MSWINLGEVFYVLMRSRGEEPAMEAIRDLRRVIEVQLPSATLVLEAGRLKARYPLAYADAFAAATSIAWDATLWTGDPELCVNGSPWRWRDLR